MSPGNGTALRPSGAHEIDDLASVFLFLGQVAERDVGTFARKGDGHGATDARIPASNQGFAAGETAGSTVAVFAVIRPWLHAACKARAWLLLCLERRLRELAVRALNGRPFRRMWRC
jgi:hypothetical protein